jgi:cold shock CspA family protein
MATRTSGTVKWFNAKNGYGFITRSDTGEDIFVHHKSIARKNPCHSFKSLGDGEAVQFNMMASDVTGVGRTPVHGDPFASMIPVRRADYQAAGDGSGFRRASQRTGASRIPRWSPIYRSGGGANN